MKLYLAGPMTGIKDLNLPLFFAEAARLRALGHEVVNPAEINGGEAEIAATVRMTPEQYQQHWYACMKRDIAALVTCDGIAMLDGWWLSKGARIEFGLAEKLGLSVHQASSIGGAV